MKEIIGFITIILAFVALYPYIVDIFRNKTKPHVFTWIIWAIATILVFFGQWQKGGGPGSWTTGVTGILTIFIALISIKKGSKDITNSDKIIFIGALLTIIPWLLTKDPTLSVILLTLIDVLAFFPTIRKTINDPQSETFISYFLNVFRHGLSIFALTKYNLATYIFPAALVIMNLVVVIMISKSNHKK